MSSLLLAGCTDTGARLDDFGDNVVDATVEEVFDARPLDALPDVTGTFYASMTAAIAPTSPFHFRAELVLEQLPDGTGLLDVSVMPLTTADRQPVGDPLGQQDVPVNMNGQFTANFDGVIPGEANPLSSNPVTLDVDLELTIRDADTICGVANGKTTAPIELDVTGSIVVSVRVAPGTAGDDLPPARTDCPDATAPDAGPVGADAAPADGGGDPDAA